MKGSKKILVNLLGIAGLASVAGAQSYHGTLGLQASDFMPVNSTIRGDFGSNIFTVGLTFNPTKIPTRPAIAWDVDAIGANKNGSRFLLIPVTVGIQAALSRSDPNSVPYVRVEAGFAYYNYSIIQNMAKVGTTTVLPAAQAELGVVFDNRLTISATYHFFARSNSFDFDGFSLGASYTLFKF